jgi:hypothetical protein
MAACEDQTKLIVLDALRLGLVLRLRDRDLARNLLELAA